MQSAAAYIVTPHEVDVQLATSLLRDAGIAARGCSSLGELCRVPGDEIACAVMVEEALVHPDIDQFLEVLAAQAPWSDLPLVLIASQGVGLSALVERVFPESGNVAVLERPMNPVTLLSAVHVGLRARQRQFEVRDLLEQRSSALRMRDEFLAMLAHELRNPLAPMRNAVYIMKRLEIGHPVFAKTRDLIDRQVTHMSRLVDDLLDVSRLERGKVQLQMQALDLNAAVAAAIDTCYPPGTERRHDVQVRLTDEPLIVRADPVRIEQIVGNLVTNAAKFTPEGGRIVVSVLAEPDTAAVSVQDSGVGIRGDMLKAIFDLFTQDATTLARAEGGLGIGLTIVKRLVELHGGHIRVASEGPGQGSRFVVAFPRSESAVCDASQPEPDAKGFTSARILVIEDNPDIRDALGLLLNMWGYAVEYAATGPDGLRRADELRPDVVLIDIGLPGLDGYEVARRIRRQKTSWAARVRLVALTGYGRDSDRKEALQAGFNRHLVKPVDPDVLASTLQLQE